MRTRVRRYERGDTIVEMIFAFAIFSLILIGILTIMNTGVSISQQSVEETLVRQQIDAQAEMIRFIHDTNNPAWTTLKDNVASDIMPLSSSSSACPSLDAINAGSHHAFFVTQASDGGFTVNAVNGTNYLSPETYAQIQYGSGKSYGMWLQLARAENDSSSSSIGKKIDAYDVYIHACWSRVGSGIPVTLGTIVRLYDQKYIAVTDPSGGGGGGGGSGPSGPDAAQVTKNPGCHDDDSCDGDHHPAMSYVYTVKLSVQTSVPDQQIAGCSWYWDDDSMSVKNISGTDGCASSTTVSHDYSGDSHMLKLQNDPDYRFPVACNPKKYPGATGVGARTFTVYVVIHKLGGGDVRSDSVNITRPACAA